MIYTSLQGVRIPALGLGTWQLSGSSGTSAVEDALAIGYRHIDTAQMYHNEAEVGAAIQHAGVERSELFITTKIWPDNLEPLKVRQFTEDSLRKLKTEYVDLLLIHWPSERVPLEKTLEAMFDVQSQQKTRYVGVSNFPPALLQKALSVGPISCNQVEYHPFLSQQPLWDLCQQEKVLLTAYSPLALGKVNSDPTIQEIGRVHGKTPAQVTLRWLLQQEGVAAIPKAAKAEHRRSNFDIFDFELNEGEMSRIYALSRDERLINPGFAPDWEN